MEWIPLTEWPDWGRAAFESPSFSCMALWGALVWEQVLPMAPTTLCKTECDHAACLCPSSGMLLFLPPPSALPCSPLASQLELSPSCVSRQCTRVIVSGCMACGLGGAGWGTEHTARSWGCVEGGKPAAQLLRCHNQMGEIGHAMKKPQNRT